MNYLSISLLGSVRYSFAALIVLSLISELASGQSTGSRQLLLVNAAEQAKSELNASTLPNRTRASEAYLRDVESAQRFFQFNTARENGEAWLRYLKLDALRDAVQSDSSVAEQGNLAVAMRERLVGIAPGLELQVLVQLRRSVNELIASLRFSESDKAIEQIEKQLSALSERASEFKDIPSAEDTATVSAIVSVLREAGQSPQAVQSIRNLFSQPNAVFTVHESLVQQTVNRCVDQSKPVSNCILGTRLIGTASLHGNVSADLQPSLGAALLTVSLQGNFSSQNRGYNGPVVLNTTGVGQVFASRGMLLSEKGVSMQPAYVRASLTSEIQSIEHRLRIVRRIASKKAAEQKPQADRIAVEKLRQQVGEQFMQETSQSQSMSLGDPLEKVRPWLGRLELNEPTRTWGSTFDSLFIQGLLRRDDQLGSTVSAPPVSGAYDIAIQIHETLVDNALTPMLAGRTVKQSQIEPLLELTGRKSASVAKKPSDPLPLEDLGDAAVEAEPPFEIDFARFRPVIFEARDGVLRVGVRGTRFAQGRRELSRAMEITAEYTPAHDDAGHYMLIRNGDVGVSFPGRGRLTISQSAIKTTIQKSFAEVFPEVIADQTIIVPPEAPLDAIRGKHYRPSQIMANDGWLTIAVR